MKTNVTFLSNNLELAGHLYTPDGHQQGPLPGVVIPHPWGGVKEQAATVYARKLCQEGFATLVFDAAYQGESEGEPRFLEIPAQRAEDIRSAVSLLSTRAEVDPERIGGLGLFASGSYMPFAAQTDLRIKAVAAVSTVDVGSMLREGLFGEQDEEALRVLLTEVGAARTEEAQGKGVRLQGIFPETREEVAELPPIYQEAWEYYMTERGAHPRSKSQFVFRSVDHLVQFDACAMLRLLAPRPLLVMEGSESSVADHSRRFIENAPGPKEMFWVEGATHGDLLYKEEFITPAIAKLTDFFRQSLNG
ncbi:CocE/NonD family hydrolase [Streptomyces griseoluteus]|uniref:alpha/beta hydrolase n=1 Tax=Streptomyces griseoluteus TaxID=29306 RepID=UPI0036E7D33D